MFRQRVLSALVFVPIVIGVFLAGGVWLTLGVALLALVAAHETFRLLRLAGLPAERAIGLIAAPAAVLAFRFTDGREWLVSGFVGVVVVAAGIAAFRRAEPRDGFLAWVGTSFGALYASLLAFLPGIVAAAPDVRPGSPVAALGDGRAWLMILVLTVWAFDVFAYLSGRTFRRGRFLAHISPQKTWSGVVGGGLAAILVSGALVVVVTGHHVIGGLALGLLVAVTAQAGDVAESLLKRAAGAKESGSAIPGHGGVLDRVDSFLFAAPAFYVALTWIELLYVGGPV